MSRISRRAFLRRGGLAAAVVTCLRQHTDHGGREEWVPGTSTVNLHLTARIAREETHYLYLEWTLVNGSLEPIIVLRHLLHGFGAGGRLHPEPDLAYISVSEDGTVEVSKKVFRSPELLMNGRRMLVSPVPLGEELAPGGRMSETFALHLPVFPWDPYGAYAQTAAGEDGILTDVQAKRIGFHLGVYRPGSGRPATVVETDRGKLLYPDYTSTLVAQAVLDAPRIPWSGAAVQFR